MARQNPFAEKSDIQIRQIATGKYAGRWEVYRVSTGESICDYATEEHANKAISGIRKYARERMQALKDQDKPLRW